MQQFVQLLVPAHPAAVQERVQRLLLAVLGQAAEPARARPGVHAALLALFERARQAAAAAGLLHQLTAHRHRRAHGPGLLIARLARHVRRAAAGDAQQGDHQEGNTQQHGAPVVWTARCWTETATIINCILWWSLSLQKVGIHTSVGGVLHPQVLYALKSQMSAHPMLEIHKDSAPPCAVLQPCRNELKKKISRHRVSLPALVPFTRKPLVSKWFRKPDSGSRSLCRFFHPHGLWAKCIICGFELAF